jgi:hypothetical protein
MMQILKRNGSKRIVISCCIFMAAVILGNPARAGDMQWSLQFQFPITEHQHRYNGHGHGHGHGHRHRNRHGDSIGTGPRTRNSYNNGNWRPHNGYKVIREFRNYHGELCREYQMQVNIGGYLELAWGEACRDYYGQWRVTR